MNNFTELDNKKTLHSCGLKHEDLNKFRISQNFAVDISTHGKYQVVSNGVIYPHLFLDRLQAFQFICEQTIFSDSEVISEENSLSSKEMIDLMEYNKNIVLFGLTQSGKTRLSCVWFLEMKAKYPEMQLIFILGVSDNDLKNQVKNKFQGFRLNSVIVLHNTDLNLRNTEKLSQLIDINKPMAIWSDESHVADGADNLRLKFYTDFLKLEGVGTKSFENERDIYIVMSSATPLQDLLRDMEFVMLQPGKDYRSMADLQNHIFNISDYNFPDALTEHVESDIEENEFNYFILRGVEKKQAEYKKIISQLKKDKNIEIRTETFDCEQDNIRNLNNFLQEKPNETTVIFIKSAARVGKDFDCKSFIKTWWDGDSKFSDSIMQAGIGRLCGYKPTHPKLKIYVNLKAVVDFVKLQNIFKEKDKSKLIKYMKNDFDFKDKYGEKHKNYIAPFKPLPVKKYHYKGKMPPERAGRSEFLAKQIPEIKCILNKYEDHTIVRDIKKGRDYSVELENAFRAGKSSSAGLDKKNGCVMFFNDLEQTVYLLENEKCSHDNQIIEVPYTKTQKPHYSGQEANFIDITEKLN